MNYIMINTGKSYSVLPVSSTCLLSTHIQCLTTPLFPQAHIKFSFYTLPNSCHRLSSARTSLRTKRLAGKSTRIPTFSQVTGSIWGQQPEQVDKVFHALKKGLKYAQFFCYTICFCDHCSAAV